MSHKIFKLDNIFVEEFDKSKHMTFAKDIMDFDEELTKSQSRYNPAKFDDEESLGKITYEKYIELMLSNNWRVFVILLNNKCIGYIHTSPGKFENSVYIGSFIITKNHTNKGYGKEAMKQFQTLIKSDYDIMILNVSFKNKGAIALYERDGFKPFSISMSKLL